MNKKLCTTAAIMSAAMLTTSAMAADISVYLDGKALSFDVAPIIENDRTLVPLRAIFEAMGAEVMWDEATRTVISAKGETSVVFQIDNASMFVNGEEKTLDVPAKIKDDRTLIPLRAVSEAYGCGVDWDGATYTVTIVSSPTSTTEDAKAE